MRTDVPLFRGEVSGAGLHLSAGGLGFKSCIKRTCAFLLNGWQVHCRACGGGVWEEQRVEGFTGVFCCGSDVGIEGQLWRVL